uniref:Calponin-homology (CH) domain-containing protein n=1 Tax=Ascaris lumbricoides TaxID=6252 RepID=A0A0M3HZC1_ASCLU
MLRSMAVDYCKANNIESLIDFESMDNASRLVVAELFHAVLSFHQENEADQRESVPALLSCQMSSANIHSEPVSSIYGVNPCYNNWKIAVQRWLVC